MHFGVTNPVIQTFATIQGLHARKGLSTLATKLPITATLCCLKRQHCCPKRQHSCPTRRICVAVFGDSSRPKRQQIIVGRSYIVPENGNIVAQNGNGNGDFVAVCGNNLLPFSATLLLVWTGHKVPSRTVSSFMSPEAQPRRYYSASNLNATYYCGRHHRIFSRSYCCTHYDRLLASYRRLSVCDAVHCGYKR